MVQRKVPNKLANQVDHDKSQKRLVNLRPSSPHHQDGKNKGADLKIKMKKSRSFKHSDFDSLRSPRGRREVPLPGKPPPLAVLTTAAILQKQSPAKAVDGLPNYMKSTSSFEARKEHSQVSSRSSQIGTNSKSPSQKNSNLKLSPSSGHKPARTLTRTSSLKLVRTLTKTRSFKPVRASVKKCSQVVLCDFNVQRATCSSTLKDSKFPVYLTLDPGGTESEGTSVMKVCPYTYCSLNGHHHAPLPPLKCFLSARRRMLKTQKIMKAGCLSPRQEKPSKDRTKDIYTGQVTFLGKPVIQELDLNSSAITPLIQEEHTDFFIQIYSKERGDCADTTDSTHEGDDKEPTDLSVDDIMPSDGGSDNTAAENEDFQVVKSLSDEPPLHQRGDFIPTNIIAEEDPDVKAADIHPPSLAQEETTVECMNNQHDLEVESPPSIQIDEPESEASDMEWEAGQYFAPYLDDEVDGSIQINNKSYLESGYSLGSDQFTFHDEAIFQSDETVSSCFKEILTDEVLQESFDEESISSGARFVDSESKSEGSYQNLETDESIEASDNQSDDHSSPYDALEESTTPEESKGDTKSDDFVDIVMDSIPAGEPLKEPRAASEDENGVSKADPENSRTDLQLGDNEAEGTISKEDEHQKNESLRDENATALLGNEETNFSPDLTKQDQNERYDDCAANHNNIEVSQSDAGLPAKTEDSEAEQNCFDQECFTVDAGDGVEVKEQVDSTKPYIGIQTFDLLPGSCEANQDTNENHNKSQLGAITEDCKSNQILADKGLPTESQSHSQSCINNIVENHNYSKQEKGKAENFKTSNSMDSEDQTYSGMTSLTSAGKRDQDDQKLEVEHATKSNAKERCLRAKNTSCTETRNALFHAGSETNQELPWTCKDPRGPIRCKRPIGEQEELRKFNPREPNYLPVQPDPEAEKVDLRHQMMDERKNAEEWMLDYALQRAVTKLAPARKRKVALLVEAFEAVTPTPKYEAHLRHSSTNFPHARPIQACS